VQSVFLALRSIWEAPSQGDSLCKPYTVVGCGEECDVTLVWKVLL